MKLLKLTKLYRQNTWIRKIFAYFQIYIEFVHGSTEQMYFFLITINRVFFWATETDGICEIIK